MSCTITVSGKDSATFNALAAEFGGRAALESILDSDGTSTIDGFLSDVEQSNRVNAVAYHVLDYLRSIDAVTSLDMSPKMLSEDNIKVALEAARNNFVSIIQDNLSENMSEEEKRVASRAYVAYRNFSELVPKVIRKFENFGLTIAEVNNDMDHISDMEESETSDKQHIYSQSNLERNPLDSVSPSVKLFFSARPRKVFDASGEVVNAIDDLGMAVPVDFHDLYSKVMKNLTDISTYEEMEAKLEELAEVDPDIKGLVEDLQDAKFDKRGVTINGIKSTPLKNAFFTAMNNTQYDHLSVIIDVDRYAEEPGVKKVSLLEPNRRNLSKSLRNEWASNVTKLMKLPKSQKVELWEKRVQKVFDPSSSFSDISLKKERKKAFDKQLADPKSKVALVNVANMLELIGIRVSPEAVSVLRTNMNRQESGGFAKFVNSKLYNLGKNFYTGDTNIFESEITTLTLLSDAQANLKGELGNRSFLNGEGNLVFPINKPTFAKEWFSEMSNKGKLFEDLANDPFYGESKIVKDFIEEYDIQMRSFDTITDNTTNSVIPFSELDPVTSLATRYNLFMNYNSKGILSKIDSKYGWFMVPTPADRTGTQVFKMRLLGRGKFVDKFNVFSEESGYKDWAINSAKAEFKRIATVREEFQLFKDNTSELVENYHYIGNELGNGGYFQYFPELNQFLKEEDGVLQDVDFSSPEVLSALETAIQDQIAEDINYLQEIGFLENDSSPKPSKQAKKFIKAPHFDESSLYKFLLNSYVANQELSSLMYGDIAHFKGNRVELESGDIVSQTNLANANKRAGLAFTPGSKLRVGNGGVKATFEVAFVNDVINDLESDVYDSIDESIPKNQAEKYKRTNSTDGQGFATLDRYAELLNGQGLYTPAMQTTLNELKKDNPDWNKVTEKLVPVKGFYHSNEFDGEFNRVMPKNLKYSLLPVFPSMMKNNPKLQEMYKKMENSEVEELVFVSGSKMGAYNVNNAEDAIYKTVTLNNNRYRIPQVVPYKSKVLENFGSQMRKLIESNLVEDGDYNGKSGSQLKDDYNAAISLKIQNAFRDMIESFISDGHIDIEKVAKRVLDEIENNKYRSDSDFINKALEIIETETGKDTRVPMSFPAIKYKVESVLNSMAKKAVNRLTLPGFVGVVYTSYGMNTGEISVDKTLKFVRKDKNGNVLPAQVKMSPQYFLGILRDKTKKLTNDLARTKNDEVKVQIQEEIKDINSVISQLVSGTFDITKMPAHVRQGVIYRIPTQGKNSMLPIEVVEFTPEAFSTSITLPAAIVTQSGMDYDIDKVYVELKHTSYSNGQFYTATPSLNTREGIDNTIVQTHYDVLTSPLHFKELVTPNNTDTLEKLVDEISEIYEVNRVGSKWSSVSTQDGFRDKNQAGGVFIGIASNANTAHALYQSLGVNLGSENTSPTSNENAYNRIQSIDFENQDTSISIEIKGDSGKEFLLTRDRNSTQYKLWSEKQEDGSYTTSLDTPTKAQVENLAVKYIPVETRKAIDRWVELHQDVNWMTNPELVNLEKRLKKELFPEALMAAREELRGNSEVNVPDLKFKGGYDNIGKGTPQGDGKDKAMRKIADSAIVELASNKPSSSKTTLDSLGSPDHNSEIVMLARNGELNGKPLSEKTKADILDAHRFGLKFVVGDMPGVDSQFISYLTEIGADFTIYHTGKTPRITNVPKVVSSTEETGVTGVTVNGKAVKSLSLVQNALGGLISDDHIEIQTAAVDNASNPLLGHLNINTVTGSTFLFLVESGAGLNYSVRLLNTPIIRELVRRTRINEATMGKEGAYQDALSSLAKDRKFNMEYVNKNDYDVSISDIDNVINSARGGEMVSDHDFDILRAFITFKRYGDSLVTFQSAMRHDVKGTRQTIAANVLATNKLARISNTYSDENYKGHYIDSYVPVFFDKDKYNKHSIKTFEEYGLHKPIQLAGLFIADSSDTFRTLLDRVSDDLGNMNDTDARLLMTDFYTFLFANQAPHADLNTRSIISETVPETTLELMVGQNSVAKKLIAAKLKEHTRAKEDLSYIPNMLLSSLSAELDNRQTGTDVVSFNNSISRALTSDQKSLLSNEFYELLVHEDPFYRSLALELFALNFFTEGFSRGINSYSEFIPIEIYEHFKGESGKSMVDYFRDLWQDFQDPKKFNISDFVFKFYANRGQELSGIRDLTNMSDSKLKSYLAKNPKVKVFLTKTKGKVAIGSRIPESNDYSIITETMGTKGWRVDYQGFGEVSRALSSMQALKVEEAKSNVEQKNC